jgi:branched-chain amino acid transport system substrate-binding protein
MSAMDARFRGHDIEGQAQGTIVLNESTPTGGDEHMTWRQSLLLSAALALGLAALSPAAKAQISDDVVKIGVLNDRSGLYADLSGEGSVVAAQMAVEDFDAAGKGLKVEIISGDHQNKPDIGSSIARQWFDVDKVDVIADVPTSSVALAINEVVREKKKAFLVSGAAASDLTGKACSPNTVHWTYDTWALANGTGKAIVKTGGDTWFFITADYAFGQALERDTTAVVQANGGKVLGSVRHPLSTPDFSSFLLQAQSSGAKIIGLANAGGDTINSIKQAAEFGITSGGQNLAGLLVFLTDVRSIGLQTAQGLILTESFYWDLNDQTRAWSKRFAERHDGKYPTMVQAGVYASILHYLKAVEALKSDDGTAVIAKMKELPTDDPLFGKGTIRADGRKIHDMYLFQVKKPEESKGEWDLYNLRATIPAAEAFRPLDQGGCPLVK